MYPLTDCPGCGQPCEQGFAARASGLSFFSAEKLFSFTALDEDLSGAGLRKYLPHKSQFYPASLCRGCEIYVVCYKTVLDRKAAQELVRTRR